MACDPNGSPELCRSERGHALPLRGPSTGPLARLDEALEMAPIKSGRVRRMHGAFTRAVQAVLASAAELELVDDSDDDRAWLLREATDLAITASLRIGVAGRSK